MSHATNHVYLWTYWIYSQLLRDLEALDPCVSTPLKKLPRRKGPALRHTEAQSCTTEIQTCSTHEQLQPRSPNSEPCLGLDNMHEGYQSGVLSKAEENYLHAPMGRLSLFTALALISSIDTRAQFRGKS